MLRRAVLATATILALALPAFADGDPANGENVFKKCRACHEVGAEAENRVGPELNGVIGRTAGTAPDFKYSASMTEAGAGGLVWTEETIAEYLTDPRGFVPKNKMAFAGLKKPEEIADVIAYLEQFPAE